MWMMRWQASTVRPYLQVQPAPVMQRRKLKSKANFQSRLCCYHYKR